MPVLSRGVFTISIDTEFAWGTFDLPEAMTYRKLEARSREVITRLLGLFETYNIEATWAVVGHLFLESCAPPLIATVASIKTFLGQTTRATQMTGTAATPAVTPPPSHSGTPRTLFASCLRHSHRRRSAPTPFRTSSLVNRDAPRRRLPAI